MLSHSAAGVISAFLKNEFTVCAITKASSYDMISCHASVQLPECNVSNRCPVHSSRKPRALICDWDEASGAHNTSGVHVPPDTTKATPSSIWLNSIEYIRNVPYCTCARRFARDIAVVMLANVLQHCSRAAEGITLSRMLCHQQLQQVSQAADTLSLDCGFGSILRSLAVRMTTATRDKH